MKKGFTLIELLAVIVILVIIALIATPIILGIINDAREQTKHRVAELIAKETELAYTSYLFEHNGLGDADHFCAYMTNEYFSMDNGEIVTEGDNFETCTDENKKVKVKSGNDYYDVVYDVGTVKIYQEGQDTTKEAILQVKLKESQEKYGYTVEYVVEPDSFYGEPEDFTTPIDSKSYASGEMVYVVDPLTTTVDYAYNDKNEKISGTWEFIPWDKTDFNIYEDTTITGGWKFNRTYKYIVHYVLWEDYRNGKTTKVADDEPKEIEKLGITVTEPAKTGNELKAKYRKSYQPVPGYESVTVNINRDGYEIYIFYQKKPTSS